jgi:crotonobetainyl-CoA:carnitine CoA-transferase CaiB-like acyl-CoA transferase
MNSHPLAGVTILDFTLLLPGAHCTQLLGDLGATVLKVEPPTGDPGRHVAQASFWSAANRGKQSLVIDLKNTAAQQVCQRLAQRSDVAVEAYRPGVAHRLGISAAALRKHNPALVYCSLSGYGQSGPLRDRPGHDINYLASGGGLDYGGRWGEASTRSGIPVADVGAGMLAALSIVAALLCRDRGGAPATLDLSLRDVVLSMASLRAGPDLTLPSAQRAHLQPTNDVFVAADGVPLAFGLVEQRFWDRFVTAVQPSFARFADARFADDAGRRANGDELSQLLAEAVSTRSAKWWRETLAAADVPVEPLLSYPDALTHPATAARELIDTGHGERLVRFPTHWEGGTLPLTGAAPALGVDTYRVLIESGYTDAEVSELVAAGVVGVAPTESSDHGVGP